MTSLHVEDTPLSGVRIVTRTMRGDARGRFARLFCARELADAGWTKPVAQVNHSLTARKGAVRGMHYQNPPHAEMKLVTCTRGRVYDVVVDVRAGSPTFLQTFGLELSAAEPRSLLIPEGVAHGFQTLTEDCELLYLHTEFYAPEAEAGLLVDDPRLAIPWPLPLVARSERDGRHPLLSDAFPGVRV